MPLLNQIIAIEGGVKSRSTESVTQLFRDVQKPALVMGISRSYRPRDDEGEQLPPESTLVQLRVDDVLAQVVDLNTELWDVVATKDWANCMARADVVLDDGTVLIAAARPVRIVGLGRGPGLPCDATDRDNAREEGHAQPREGRGH